MDSLDIVNGNKQTLIGEYRTLYVVHGRKWRSILREFSEWHSTDKGLLAWQNISRGTVGNESLRRILSDMKAVISRDAKPAIVKRQGLTTKLTTTK